LDLQHTGTPGPAAPTDRELALAHALKQEQRAHAETRNYLWRALRMAQHYRLLAHQEPPVDQGVPNPE